MKIVSDRRFFPLVSLVALGLISVALPVQAETINTQPLELNTTPVPGTVATSAALLNTSTSTSSPAVESNSEVAQIDVDPGQATRGGSSYIGVAGNIGLGGDSGLGDGAFVVISKIGFTNAISARPSVLIEDDPVILIPVTYDFNIRPADAFEDTFPVAPYIGGGIAIETSDDSDVGLLLTGGVDFPISPEFTATAAVNAAFLDETDVGLLLGVGYNFSGLGDL